MKILILTNNLKKQDGWSRYSYDYIKELSYLKNKLLILVSEEKRLDFKCKQEKILFSPLKYIRFPFLAFISSFTILKKIKEFQPDIIHFMVEPYALILPFLRLKKIKTVLTIHGTYSILPLLKKRTKFLARKYYKKIDIIIAVSQYTKNYLKKLFPKLEIENKLKVVTNGVALKEGSIRNSRRFLKTKKIIFVGAIKPRKGIIESIEALNIYNNRHHNFIFEIFGKYDQNSKYFRKIKNLIKKYKLENKIFIRGFVNQIKIKKAYRNADLFLMLSKEENYQFEGFGLVFLEANTFGVPCIGSKKSGCEEAIKNAFSGFIVNPYDPNEVANRIEDILDKNLIKKENCLKWARINDIKIKAKELQDIYLKLKYETY